MTGGGSMNPIPSEWRQTTLWPVTPPTPLQAPDIQEPLRTTSVPGVRILPNALLPLPLLA